MTNLPLVINGEKYEFQLKQRLATVCDVRLHGELVAQGVTFLKPGEQNDPEYGTEVAMNRAADALGDAGVVPERLTKALGGLMFRKLTAYVEGPFTKQLEEKDRQAAIEAVSDALDGLDRLLDDLELLQSNYSPIPLPVGEFRISTLPKNVVFFGDRETTGDYQLRSFKQPTQGYFVVTDEGVQMVDSPNDTHPAYDGDRFWRDFNRENTNIKVLSWN